VNNQDLIARNIVSDYRSRLYERFLRLYEEPLYYLFKASSKGYFFMSRSRDYRIGIIYRDGETKDLVTSSSLGRDVTITNYYINYKGDLLAYYYSKGGRDVGRLEIIDVESGEHVDAIDGSIHGIVFLNRERYYYVKFYRSERCPDGVQAPCDRVFIRESGKDEMIFGEGVGTSHFISLKSSSDRSKALINVMYGWRSSTIYYGDLMRPETWSKIYGGDHLYYPIDYVNNCVIVRAYDRDGLGRILCVGNIVKEIVSESNEYMSSAAVLNDKLITVYIDADQYFEKLRFYDLNGNMIGSYVPENPSSINIYVDQSVENELLIELTSFLQKYKVIKISSDLNVSVIKESRVHKDFEVEHGYTSSYDGTRIHYFIIKRKGLDPREIVLYGYGGFGIALTPNYYIWAIPLIDDGMALVVTNLRGGSEHGEKWHFDGAGRRKINVFMDFIAVAEDLRRRLGDVKIVAHGRSNGGLLVAASAIMRPDLFNAVVIGYPVLDMLRFDKLYIGRAWVPEYGDPSNSEDREYLLKYSPYHNIRPGEKYPPMYIYTGLNDDRVHPAHAFKFHAKLREYGHQSCLRVERSSGHIGSTPEVLAEETADYIGFIYMVLNK